MLLLAQALASSGSGQLRQWPVYVVLAPRTCRLPNGTGAILGVLQLLLRWARCGARTVGDAFFPYRETFPCFS